MNHGDTEAQRKKLNDLTGTSAATPNRRSDVMRVVQLLCASVPLWFK